MIALREDTIKDLEKMERTVTRLIELKAELERRHNPTPLQKYTDDITNYLAYKFPDESQVNIMEAASYIGNRVGIMVQDAMREYETECRKHYQRYYDELFKVMKKGDKED